ncbi:hypothetical protein SLEP1_g58704 [Rubroshorea leprosula]|uniref:Uncharacterized protein n=1 Tax=Rubroshorea leprosula TaxID=152421 RepID=A0AAV5MUP6_9ROSI|nr:hypothetical protein SLEP1_g58704 [Rubroshorea leprosula]
MFLWFSKSHQPHFICQSNLIKKRLLEQALTMCSLYDMK